MAHHLFRLTQKLYGVPHLIERNSFNHITSYLASRNSKMFAPVSEESSIDADACTEDPEIIGGIAVIEIEGTLTNKDTGFEALCGGCSYESITEAVESALEDGVTTIVLSINSGGGEAYGVFLAAEEIRKMCDDAGTKLIGYVDGNCASAAYALGCVCDELIANPYAEVGSIGVLIALMDSSKHLEQEGYKPVFVSAGAQKIPFADDGSFKQEFLDDLQVKVDSLYESFVSHVSKHTGLPSEVIKATEAKTFLANDALSIGLINKIMSNTAFVEYVVATNKG